MQCKKNFSTLRMYLVNKNLFILLYHNYALSFVYSTMVFTMFTEYANPRASFTKLKNYDTKKENRLCCWSIACKDCCIDRRRIFPQPLTKWPTPTPNSTCNWSLQLNTVKLSLRRRLKIELNNIFVQ